MIAAIAVWEAIKWFFEWLSLRRSGSVEEARGARRLRRLQQAVQEEVSRYGLEEPAPPPLQSRVRTRDVVIQTDPVPAPPPVRPINDPYIRFQGPFVMSEHGDRVHYDPQCHGLRNAMTRRRQLMLCHYCEGRRALFQLDG